MDRKTIELPPKDQTPEQERGVERVQFAGLLVMLVGVIGAQILHRLFHVAAWPAVAAFVVVIALDLLISTLLMARIWKVGASAIAREGVRSIRHDAVRKAGKIKSLFHR
jgi:hypothetical protein